jgi:hypothetical protein
MVVFFFDSIVLISLLFGHRPFTLTADASLLDCHPDKQAATAAILRLLESSKMILLVLV